MEQFSVSNLVDYRWIRDRENFDDLKNFLAHNLASSSFRENSPTPNFSRMSQDQAKAVLIHDSALELYSAADEMAEDIQASEIKQILESNITEETGRLGRQFRDFEDSGISREHVKSGKIYGRKVDDVLNSIADFYAESLPLEDFEILHIEDELSNNSFTGRADLVRRLDGITELRDVKTHYTNERPIFPVDDYKISAYALLAHGEDLEIDRVVLEYPVQGQQYEVEPENWLAYIASDASELEALLEDTRRLQADKLEEVYGRPHLHSDREYVEALDAAVHGEKKEYARRAAEEVIAENFPEASSRS
ncbi:hypothetical protein ACK3SF_00940 [Candidatus Nanosalina sp. VS9-1]|uniref:hypothetical protein n=1 Tax=Candidatus Nanosalina sp. VS9-1 TaxID=3388566 RepID=UPI0039E03BF2